MTRYILRAVSSYTQGMQCSLHITRAITVLENICLDGYVLNTRANLIYLTWWSLPTRNAQIDWQVQLSGCVAVPLHLRVNCDAQINFARTLGEGFDIRDGSCTVFVPLVLSAMMCLHFRKVNCIEPLCSLCENTHIPQITLSLDNHW